MTPVLVAMLGACDPSPSPAPAPSATTSTVVPVPASASASAPVPTASVSAPAARETHFVGTVEVHKAKVRLPSGVKVTAWRADDGKALAGKVDLDVVLAADGVVSGSGKGALGDLRVTGGWDNERVHAEIVSKEPTAEEAVRGTLEVTRSEKGLVGKLRASSIDANLVREADVVLAPKP